MAGHSYDEDEGKGDEQKVKGKKDWDCPDCNANNPVDDPIADRDELRCNYCGTEYKVVLTDAGKFKFKEI